MKKYRLIVYNCQKCGLQVKILIKKDGKLMFSILDKLYSSKQVLTDLGNYRCINCKEISIHFHFEYIYG